MPKIFKKERDFYCFEIPTDIAKNRLTILAIEFQKLLKTHLDIFNKTINCGIPIRFNFRVLNNTF